MTPNSAQAGSRVNMRASCDNNNNRQADVHSDAFGRVMLRPDNGFLTGSVTIPGNKAAGDYPVDLRCQNSNTATHHPDRAEHGAAQQGAGDRWRRHRRRAATARCCCSAGVAAVALVAAFGAYRAQPPPDRTARSTRAIAWPAASRAAAAGTAPRPIRPALRGSLTRWPGAFCRQAVGRQPVVPASAPPPASGPLVRPGPVRPAR